MKPTAQERAEAPTRKLYSRMVCSVCVWWAGKWMHVSSKDSIHQFGHARGCGLEKQGAQCVPVAGSKNADPKTPRGLSNPVGSMRALV